MNHQLTVSSRTNPDKPLVRLVPSQLPDENIAALYVHIPFCFHKCHYCDFYSITRQSPERMERFVDLLLAEADLWQASRAIISTVFFGGGTPSLLPQPQMHRLLLGLRQRLAVSANAEWTVECNPATVNQEYLAMLLAAGVNRLSFGAQSFSPTELAMLERHHAPEDVERSLDLARAAGFRRLNMDLIFGIPGQTLSDWEVNLARALAVGTDHLSCYALTYEPNTPMAVKKRLGVLAPVAESAELDMLRHTRNRLASAGLPAYEISNYARPGEECRHNLAYWSGDNYIGLGPSAASHVGGWRWKNRPHLGEWESAVSASLVPVEDVEHLQPIHRAAEMAYLQIRTTTGINPQELSRRCGVDFCTTFAPAIDRLIYSKIATWTDGRLTLTDRGVELADSAAAELLALRH